MQNVENFRILPIEDLPQQELAVRFDELAQQYNAINEKYQGITNLYFQAIAENEMIQDALEKNFLGDNQLVDGCSAALMASKKENGILLAKIAFLESRQNEISAAHEAQLKAAQVNIIELENCNENIKNEMQVLELYVNEDQQPPKKFIDYCAKIYRQAEKINKLGRVIIPLDEFNLAQMSRHSAAQLSSMIKDYNSHCFLGALTVRRHEKELIEKPTLKKFCKNHQEDISNLTNLHIRGRITSIPPCIEILVNLQSLILNGNQIAEFPLQITKLTNIKILSLGENNLEEIPAEIYLMNSLQTLDFYNNKINEVSSKIGNLKNLEFLNLGYNLITTLPEAFGELVSLRNLELIGNKNFIIPPVISKLNKLERLSVIEQISPTIDLLKNRGVKVVEGKKDNCVIS